MKKTATIITVLFLLLCASSTVFADTVPCTHRYKTSIGYEKLDNEHHTHVYECDSCHEEIRVEEEHFWSGTSYTYKSVDKTYHTINFTCKYCGDKISQKREHSYSTDYSRSRVNDKYHGYYSRCSSCGYKYVDKSNLESHDWEYTYCSKLATPTSRGQVIYDCWKCSARKKTTSPAWKYGTSYSTQYVPELVHYVYSNTTKITVKLSAPLKGSTLKVKIGKKTYKKKINNNQTRINLKIKKPAYGSKIRIQLLYNGRVVGKETDDEYYDDYDYYVWYAKKLRRGMTKKQAKFTWGWPDDTASASGGWSYWYYDNGSYITFRYGKVSSWYNS